MTDELRARFHGGSCGCYSTLEAQDEKKHKKIVKTLGLMETNLRHPSLNTHEYTSLQGPNKEKVLEAYVENRTPGAYRVFLVLRA